MRKVTPKLWMVNSDPNADWSESTWALWHEHVSPKFDNDEWCSTANYYTPRPYKNEYDRGSDKEGFTYVVQPGNRVCQWERIGK